jgi:hypothetical protein
VSIAGPPDIFSDPGAQEWTGKFRSMFKRDPTPYSVTAYQGVDRCAGPRRILGAVTAPHAVRRGLVALGLAAKPPPGRAPAA